ncbi:27743_t:CDS:2, partial [Gigaspora margarita]
MSDKEISVGKPELPPTSQSPNEVSDQPDQRVQRQHQWKLGEAINLIIGIFIAPGNIWRLVRSPGHALIFWIVGGLIKLYSFFVWKLSEKGQFDSNIYGFAFDHQLFKFLFGFATVNIIIPGAIIANSFVASKYLLYAIQGAEGQEFNHYGKDYGSYFDKDFIALRFLAVAILGIITAYHMFTIRNKYENYSICLNQILVVFKVASLLVFAIMGFFKANDPVFIPIINNNWHEMFNSTIFDNYSSSGSTFGGYGNAMLQFLIFNEIIKLKNYTKHSGWNHLSYSSEELIIEGEYRKYSVLVRVCFSFVLYILVNIAFILIVDPKVVADPNNANESIAIDYGIKLYGDFGRKYMSYLIAISSFSSMDSMVLLSSICFEELKYIPKVHEVLFARSQASYRNLFAQFVYCAIIIIIFPAVNVFAFFSEMSEYLIMLIYGASACYLI